MLFIPASIVPRTIVLPHSSFEIHGPDAAFPHGSFEKNKKIEAK
jgi:hypothetical protein